MKLLLMINKVDCPENMNREQLFDNNDHLNNWLLQVSTLLPKAKIEDNKLIFKKETGDLGYGIITEVPDDFINS